MGFFDTINIDYSRGLPELSYSARVSLLSATGFAAILALFCPTSEEQAPAA